MNILENENLPLDLTFIVNEVNKTLKDRFKELIKDCKYFDCLVGYFYLSGFHLLKNELINSEKIRILVGPGISDDIKNIIQSYNNPNEISDNQKKHDYLNLVKEELEYSEDNKLTEDGIKYFVSLIKSNKLEIRIYPKKDLHAKVYIITFKEGDRDIGRVITGSSNFTYSGLQDNIEFNVELKNYSDYKFAKEKFEELWKESIDITNDISIFIEKETWINDEITPYHLYLKFLYEYFIDDLNSDKYLKDIYLPEDYLELEYQKQAILNAKKIIEAYGGCFISDVVGTGKTYVGARLAAELGGRTLVIAPPKLISKKNPKSWRNVFADFNIPADFYSIGKLDDAIEEIEKREYHNIIIDESHRFRNNSTINYAKIANICYGKRVILVSATPYNNYPEDLLNQISLFQHKRESNIPGLRNLEKFFKDLKNKLDKISRNNDYDKYIDVVREISNEIRNKCLKYIMVRRTRNEIIKYFSEDLERNNIKFPTVVPPTAILYELDENLNKTFNDTIDIIATKLKYARYIPILYLNELDRYKIEYKDLMRQSQINLGKFMKILLVKRLESSFYAFKMSLDRFIESYEYFIEIYNKGKVYFSKNYLPEIYDAIINDNYDEILNLINEGKAYEFEASSFRDDFIKDLENDLNLLKKIKSWWYEINFDPKIEKFLYYLKSDQILKENKLIIFTESIETAEYLKQKIENNLGENVLIFTGNSPDSIKDLVIENFDAKSKIQKNDYRILISTEVLSEGVNLHRSNVVINYDIPWNPTRLMQRIGRVNRVDTKFDKIYTYNFFPTEKGENEIALVKIAKSKIEAFLNLLGNDSAILTEGEPVKSHELFDKLMSVSTLTGEDDNIESELKYLRIIEDLRDNNPDLFNKIKKLPKKIRSSRNINNIKNYQIENLEDNSLLTFFRKGKLVKFFYSKSKETIELDFLNAVKIFDCEPDEPNVNINSDKYYDYLLKNKEYFNKTILSYDVDEAKKGGKDTYKELIKVCKFLLKNNQKFTENDEKYINILITKLEQGAIPKKIVNLTLKDINLDKNDSLQNLSIIKSNIPSNFIKTNQNVIFSHSERKEIILSLYLKNGS